MVIWKVTTIDKSELEITLNKLQKENKKIKEVIPSKYKIRSNSISKDSILTEYTIVYTEEDLETESGR